MQRMQKRYIRGFLILALVLFLMLPNRSSAQIEKVFDRVKGTVGGAGQGQKSADSLKIHHRDDAADSINIYFRYPDSLKITRLDSSLNDFNKFYNVPANYITLGNNGAAAYPILFTPNLQGGWDPGFHAYDIYKFTIENTRFFKTTRPYSQITYLLASGKEQLVKILHTQNIKPNWNFGFEYRLISAPGLFKTQNTNHNNYRLFSNYQGPRKRYAAEFILLGNTLTASENGGILNDTFLNDPNHAKRFTIPTNLGGDAPTGVNVFSTKVTTGNTYNNFTFLLKQSYDVGKKDSIQINDSTREYLFYPKLRFQHTVTYDTYSFQYKDTIGFDVGGLVFSAQADSGVYKKLYDTTLSAHNGLLFQLKDSWKRLSNDFSLRQFPETKNPAQFIEAGIKLENLTGTFGTIQNSYYNVILHGEYRNKTRNKKWDAIAQGELYTTGLNSGDYKIYTSLTRYLNNKFGDIRVLFQNVNRTPAFIFNGPSSFNYKNNNEGKKENITVLSAETENPRFSLLVRNISITNYAYFKNYYQADQYASLINLTQLQAQKTFKVTKHVKLYSDVILQQTTGVTPVRVPLFYTRQRLAFEGNFYRNLFLSTGLDISYYSPYKANNYSTVTGQFVPQDSITIHNTPDVNLFLHFRIKSFTGILRAENLNTVNFANGFGFTNNNFTAPHYPTPGLIIRVGVRWGFVN